MLRSIEGIYRNGKVEQGEAPGDVREGAPVIVTFPESPVVDLRAHGIDESQAAELRTAKPRSVRAYHLNDEPPAVSHFLVKSLPGDP